MRTVIGKKDIEKERVPPTHIEPAPDTYRSRILKYIPAEVIALYVTLDALIRSSAKDHVGLQWIIFGFCIIAVILYLWRVQKVSKWKQILISSVSFFVWIFAIGGPFVNLSMYDPLHGGILLPVYTFLIPILEA